MAYNAETGNYITPEGRASFPVLAEPKPIGKNPKPGAPDKYQLTLLLDEDGQATQDFADLQEGVQEAINEKWPNPNTRPNRIKTPFLTIDDLRNKIPAGYTEKHVFIRLNSTIPVGVVVPGDNGKNVQLQDKKEIVREVYAGCNVKASVNIYAWEHPDGGAGVSLGLVNVLKTGDNEPFGASNADPADDFGEPVTKPSGASAADFMG